MKSTTYKVIRTLVACTLLILFSRCDFILNDEKDQYNEINTANIEIKKHEAKLLVSATQHNLDVIELINVVKELDLKGEAKEIADTIEDHQKFVFHEYNKLAKEHVISIPNHPKVSKQRYFNDDEVIIEEVIKTINTKLIEQKDVLDNLIAYSGNKDFKNLAKEATEHLALSIDKADNLKQEILHL